ncbi:GWxTD domain-containing protein [bacterium]|nr:MAG: GWxTD domain-containing protein [bacterium]
MISKAIKHSRYFGLLISLFALLSCKTQDPALIDTGALDSFIPGLPNFTIGAVGKYDSPQSPELEIFISIPYSSLIFNQHTDVDFESEVDIILWISSTSKGSSFNRQLTAQRTISVSNYEDTQSQKELNINQVVALSPGAYTINAVVEDRKTGKRATRTLDAVIPDPNIALITTGNWQLYGKKNGGEVHEPILTYHIGKDVKDLKAQMQMRVQDGFDVSKLHVHLLEFVADTLPARVPHFINHMRSTVEFKGIDYIKADTIEVEFSISRESLNAIQINVDLPDLSIGIYRIVAEGMDSLKQSIPYKARDFSIKRAFFPKVNHINDLIESLVYIATKQELDTLKSAESIEASKKIFESFWLNLLPNKVQANSLMSAYFTRVEDANMMFSSYKEGWKTDMGMIYIMYGVPLAIEPNMDGVVWSYSRSSSEPWLIFNFRKVETTQPNSPFVQYILERNINYEISFEKKLADWRTGKILEY